MYRVFLVDDEELIVERLRFGINWQQAGYDICGWAYDGKEAWEKIHQLYPDIVITDIRMPLMSGLELARKIQTELPHISTVILSGYADFKYAQQAIKHRVGGYCLKPVVEDELLTVLDSVRQEQEDSQSLQNKQLEICAYDTMQIGSFLSRNDINLENPAYVLYGPDYHDHIVDNPCFTLKAGKDTRIWIIDEKMLPEIKAHVQSLNNEKKLCFGLSKRIKAEQRVRDAVAEAKIASYQWFIDQKTGLRSYPNAQRRDLINILNRIDNDIRSTDKRRIEAAIASLYAELVNGNYHIQHVLYVFNYILESSKQLTEYSQNFLYEEELVNNYSSLEELFKYIKQIIFSDIKTTNNTVEIPEVVEYLHNNYAEDLTLRSVAEKFYINSDYLCKIFRKETGHNFSKYITLLRLKHACNLLQNSKLPISSVAELSGFNNYFYFAKVFKCFLNATPTEYRLQTGKEKETMHI